ncbi:hypothetical protein PVAND_000203 [Polypedilum vanderplanki]|uniref:Uncharacterized protein n=1 Tax=Polypedilum vanderplanki TaxID=319348 RepID=A0A9J6BJ46_POLVA|nr:hypothetical protein PVAND_000203 [Polypedilum vanderplanki]
MCKNSGVKEICELYKSFVRSDGWLLINSDFDKLHPGSNFLPKWTSMKNDLLEVLKLNVTNIAIKENLKMSHEMDDDSKSVAIIKGIHAFLYSAGMRTDPSGSKEIVKIRSFYEGKGYTFQPVIIGFDYNQANTKRYFLVHFEDNYYRLESFDKALEVLLKTYYIMDLKFPVSSQSIFSFLSAFFLDVQAEISPKVKSLINLLQSKLI